MRGAPRVDAELDAALRTAQDRFLAEYAPGTRARPLRWSGGRTQVLEIGEGPPLLLVHGGMGDAFDWAPMLPHLAGHFHVYAVDRPGNGLADPYDYRGVDILDHARTFLREVLDALGLDQVAVAANSMGGRWAMAFAAAHPERVSHLVLVGMPAGARRELPPELIGQAKFLRLLRRPLIGRLIRSSMRKPSARERTRKALAHLFTHPERLDATFLDTGALTTLRNRETWLNFIDAGLEGKRLRADLLITPGDLRALPMPVTFLWGERDVFDTVDHGREMAAVVRDGRFVLLRDAGHLPWVDAPRKTAAELVLAVHGDRAPRPAGREVMSVHPAESADAAA